MAFIALMAGACAENEDLCEPNDKMLDLTEETWPPRWRTQFIWCLNYGLSSDISGGGGGFMSETRTLEIAPAKMLLEIRCWKFIDHSFT